MPPHEQKLVEKDLTHVETRGGAEDQAPIQQVQTHVNPPR